jgi:hypothetical protein
MPAKSPSIMYTIEISTTYYDNHDRYFGDKPFSRNKIYRLFPSKSAAI